MWIVRLALRRPYTFVVASMLIAVLGLLSIVSMPTDIFPSIDIPVISVIWSYGGLSATEMQERITTVVERAMTTTVSNIEHLESESVRGNSVIKLYFQPGADINAAIAQVTAICQTLLKPLPTGITPPLILQYNAADVPVLMLSLGSDELSEQEISDLGNSFIRTQLVTVPGAAVPQPYGGKSRVVNIDLDPDALYAHSLSPADISNAVLAQNIVRAPGTAKMGPIEYDVAINSSPEILAQLNDIPIRYVNGAMVYLHDVAFVHDGFSPQNNLVRRDGRHSALLPVLTSGSASTLSVVNAVRSIMPRIQAGLPKSLTVSFLFDQSVFVQASIMGVLREGAIAAGLTALMILVFLHSWRSTVIIAISIPLSIVTSLLILSALGETINIMTLSGLALAVGILVDDATVTIENIERQFAEGKDLHEGILEGAAQIAVPALVSTLSISIVFVPMFFLTGVARYLFVPLAEAVVFALFASYFFSRTLVPTLVMYLLRAEVERRKNPEPEKRPGVFARIHHRFEHGFDTLRDRYSSVLSLCLEHRRLFALCFLVFFVASLALVPLLGRDFFPSVDAGQIRLHVRAKTGTRIVTTAARTDQIEGVIRQHSPSTELAGILDNIGLPTSGINLSYSNSGTIGSADAEILISLQTKHQPTAQYVQQLREQLPKAFPGISFFFEPADIVSQILNFGLPSPIDIQIVGRDLTNNYRLASQIANQIRSVPGAVDVHIMQALDQPRLQYTVDRVRTQQVGLTERDVASNLLVSLSSSFQTTPSFWLNSKNGVVYSMAVQTPQYHLDSIDALGSIPINAGNKTTPQLFENLASMQRMDEPAVVSHYNVLPAVDIFASAEGRDLGAVGADIANITSAAEKQLPAGSTLVTRGQIATMNSSFVGLLGGLAFAIVLVYLLIVVNFQSWTEAFIIITALPGALAGICWMLFLTHTTLNVPSLMGAIMSIGVATANSVLIITFANERLADTKDAFRSALEAGSTRLKPVLMTALAMIIGMVPMALGLGEGGEQNAPLGRAVIGGLFFATIATLFFVPVVFAMLRGRKETV